MIKPPKRNWTDVSDVADHPTENLLQKGGKTELEQFSVDYNLAFASYLLVLIPVLLVYLFCQKWIMNGVVAGAGK